MTMDIHEMIERFHLTPVKRNGKWMIYTESWMSKEEIEELKANREDILKELLYRKEEKARKEKERQAKIKAIPGLAEIKEALVKEEEWRWKFRKSFEHVGGKGVGTAPHYDFEKAYRQYPQAYAYLRAEKKAYSHNCQLAEIGCRAMEKVIQGDWKTAMEEMEKEEKAFAEAHQWD